MKVLKARRTYCANVSKHVFRASIDCEVSYHGVLAHQDNTLASKSHSDLVHLLRADIVDFDDEDGVVLLQQALELVEVAGLVSSLAPHFFLFDEDRLFKDKFGYP